MTPVITVNLHRGLVGIAARLAARLRLDPAATQFALETTRKALEISSIPGGEMTPEELARKLFEPAPRRRHRRAICRT